MMTAFSVSQVEAPGHRATAPNDAVDGAKPEAIFISPHQVESADGTRYGIRVLGEPRSGGNWIGWVEFTAADGSHSLQTGRETTQSSRETLAYWAAGLEPVYFEGALARAR